MVSDAQDFLEVQRFDRIGLTGRVGMLSAVAVDDEYQGIVPAYDILPMRYASIGGGVDPELTTIEPKGGQHRCPARGVGAGACGGSALLDGGSGR
jgi:hypothetical protein